MSFSGADVDGLDRLAQECQQGAQVCDEVKAACEVIVAAASFFGPFGAAFITYLKTVVIPWLTKIAEALQMFAKVLSAHSQAQRSASSSATSLPDYVTPSLPAGSTADYPSLLFPSQVAPSSADKTKEYGFVMDRDTLDSGPSVHPTVVVHSSHGEAALLAADGSNYHTRFLGVSGDAASWFGADADGLHAGAGAQGAANIADVSVAGAVPLGPDASLLVGNHTTVGVQGSAQAVASFDPGNATFGAKASLDAFAGVQSTAAADLSLPCVDLRGQATGQLGAGAAASLGAQAGDGHLQFDAAAGVALGPGAKLGGSVDVDYACVAHAVTNEVQQDVSAMEQLGRYLQAARIAPGQVPVP